MINLTNKNHQIKMKRVGREGEVLCSFEWKDSKGIKTNKVLLGGSSKSKK
jgi:hypothetical protein